MTIFRLDPIEARRSDPRWEATYVRSSCWVRAGLEGEARFRVGIATMKMVDGVPGKPLRVSPWYDPALADVGRTSLLSVHPRTIHRGRPR